MKRFIRPLAVTFLFVSSLSVLADEKGNDLLHGRYRWADDDHGRGDANVDLGRGNCCHANVPYRR